MQGRSGAIENFLLGRKRGLPNISRHFYFDLIRDNYTPVTRDVLDETSDVDGSDVLMSHTGGRDYTTQLLLAQRWCVLTMCGCLSRAAEKSSMRSHRPDVVMQLEFKLLRPIRVQDTLLPT